MLKPRRRLIAVTLVHLVGSFFAYLYCLAGVLPAAMDAGSGYGNRVFDMLSLLFFLPIIAVMRLGDAIDNVSVIGAWIENSAQLAFVPPFSLIGLPFNSLVSALLLIWSFDALDALRRQRAGATSTAERETHG